MIISQIEFTTYTIKPEKTIVHPAFYVMNIIDSAIDLIRLTLLSFTGV